MISNEYSITKSREYQEIFSLIEDSEFKMEGGLEKASDLSNRIYELNIKIEKERGHFQQKTYFSEDIGFADFDSGFFYDEFAQLHEKLEAKVISDQKGTLLLPYSFYKKYQAEFEKDRQDFVKKVESLRSKMFQMDYSSYLDRQEQLKNNFHASASIKTMRLSKRLLEPVIHGICDLVEKKEQSKGFFFRITNEKGVKNHLVGTVHVATSKVAQTPSLTHVIDQSDRLILEVDSWKLRAYYGLRQFNFMNPYNRCIDIALSNAADERGIPREGLETEQDQFEALYGNRSYWELGKSLIDYAATNYAWPLMKNYIQDVTTGSLRDRVSNYLGYVAAPAKWIINKEIELAKNFWVYVGLVSPEVLPKKTVEERASLASVVDLWQESEISILKALSTNVNNCLDEGRILSGRNLKWLVGSNENPGMIERIKNTDESLCYGVGALHLIGGQPNLLDSLSEAGLTIEQGTYNYETNEMEWKST